MPYTELQTSRSAFILSPILCTKTTRLQSTPYPLFSTSRKASVLRQHVFWEQFVQLNEHLLLYCSCLAMIYSVYNLWNYSSEKWESENFSRYSDPINQILANINKRLRVLSHLRICFRTWHVFSLGLVYLGICEQSNRAQICTKTTAPTPPKRGGLGSTAENSGAARLRC